eukprot:COSAG05_NODE_230_length_13364_cov_33.748662_1_plen_97_part_10
MSEVEEYAVDRLLSKRVQAGVTQYEVQWTGFEETTWEPAENLNGTLAQDFEAAEMRKRTIRKRTMRKPEKGSVAQDFEGTDKKRKHDSVDLLSPDGK